MDRFGRRTLARREFREGGLGLVLRGIAPWPGHHRIDGTPNQVVPGCLLHDPDFTQTLGSEAAK